MAKSVLEQIGRPDAFGDDDWRTPPILREGPNSSLPVLPKISDDWRKGFSLGGPTGGFGTIDKAPEGAKERTVPPTSGGFVAWLGAFGPRVAFAVIGLLLLAIGLGAVVFKGPRPVTVDLGALQL